MNCLLNVLGYAIAIPLSFLYDHCSKKNAEKRKSSSEENPS